MQRRFTQRIPTLSNLSYPERLARLNLEPLELRRLHFDLFYYYKILHNITPHNANDFFTFHRPPSNLRNTAPMMKRPVNCGKKYLSSFSFRSATCWNNLPESVHNCDPLNKFKNSVESLNLDAFLCGSSFAYSSNFDTRS